MALTTEEQQPNKNQTKICYSCGTPFIWGQKEGDKFIRLQLDGKTPHICVNKPTTKTPPPSSAIINQQLESQPPHLFQYKISLKTTSKCVEPDITVYGDDAETAKLKAVTLLEDTIALLIAKGFEPANIFATTASKQDPTT
jgi:hypothetical protein